MMNKNERMEMLKKAGIDTKKYFNIDLPNGLKPGATISLVINEDGQPVIINENQNDVIANQIIEDGYVRNTKLHRRFITAQTMRMLNYVSYDKKERGYTAYLNNRYDYGYTLKMMLEEVRVLSKLEVRDMESFIERSHFFTKEVVVAVLEDYMEKLKDYVNDLPNKNCKGVPYKRVKDENIFVEDLEKKLYAPLRKKISSVRHANNYNAIHKVLQNFMRDMIKLPYCAPKSKVWIDAFKGEGAYYTLKNLIMFHDCKIYNAYHYPMFGEGSGSTGYMQFLNSKLDEYQGEGWRMFALMKKVIADNDFDFNAKMREVYNK